MTFHRIHIVGGGLAGLALGIALRRREIPVTVWEAGHYPRHRVCGEFISGRGLSVLEDLGLRPVLAGAGAFLARNARFFFGNLSSPVRRVTPPAVCLSRYKLDALLAQILQESGGELRQGAARRETLGPGCVRATGRRVQTVSHGWRWFGLKVHGKNVPLTADLEMHCLPDQYVGIGRIEDDKVNICGLFRRRAAAGAATMRNVTELLRGPPSSLLRSRLEHAVFDESSFCAVAGLPLDPRRAAGGDECCIGDALTMTPPATGNGMSMAFEAAAVAAGPLEGYSRGDLTWEQARQAIACSCDRLFFRRLHWAAALQWLLFRPCINTQIGRLLLHSSWIWTMLFARTR